MEKLKTLDQIKKEVMEDIFNSLDRLCQNPEAIVVPAYIANYHLRRYEEKYPEFAEDIRKDIVYLF